MKLSENHNKTKHWAGLNRPDSDAPDIVIVGLPYDGAACLRSGASEGPERIRTLSSEIPSILETGEVLKRLVVRDDGDLPFGPDFVASFQEIEGEIIKRIGSSFLLTLGGDHSIAIPVHRAFSQKASEKIGLIFIDAHTDLSDRFQGSPYSNGCPLRRAMETEQFSPEHTILVGTRCYEPAGLQFIQEHHMLSYPAYVIAERGMAKIASEIVKQFKDLSNVYLSIDIDALDPAFAPGTGIPDAGGLSTRDLITLIRALDPLPIVGADLVEVAPQLDSNDITSFAALRMIMEIFGLVHRRKTLKKRTTLK
ncbi:agmatinase [Nitrospira defluvii]|nr:agmatinase [Nitrospira defluvii]